MKPITTFAELGELEDMFRRSERRMIATYLRNIPAGHTWFSSIVPDSSYRRLAAEIEDGSYLDTPKDISLDM